MTVQRRAPVHMIHADLVTVTADFSVTLGELVCSEDGSWYGMVQSHAGTVIRVIPLDMPERLQSGTALIFTGKFLKDCFSALRPGVVVDPLGRVFEEISNVSQGNLRLSSAVSAEEKKDFWGLRNLGDFMELRKGQGVALLGVVPGGFANLFCQITLNQRADHLVIYCQDGYKELYRYCRMAQLAGSADTAVILWTPPWATPAMRSLVSQALSMIVEKVSGEGDSLVLIDDLHSWFSALREYGETTGEILLPDGIPHTARRQLGELLDIKDVSERSSVSLIVGWRYEEDFSPFVEHPYMGRLPRFMRTGLILEEASENIVPGETSWGVLGNVGKTWRYFQELLKDIDEGSFVAAEKVQEYFGSLFVEFAPLLYRPQPSCSMSWTAEDHENLRVFFSLPSAVISEEIQRIAMEMHRLYREPADVKRRALKEWLSGAAGRIAENPAQERRGNVE